MFINIYCCKGTVWELNAIGLSTKGGQISWLGHKEIKPALQSANTYSLHWEKESQIRRAIWLSVDQLSMELYFGATLQSRAGKQLSWIFENSCLFNGRAFFLQTWVWKKKQLPRQKRADFQNYFPREPFWLTFFQCACDKANSVQSSITSQIYLLICLVCNHVNPYPFLDFNPPLFKCTNPKAKS